MPLLKKIVAGLAFSSLVISQVGAATFIDTASSPYADAIIGLEARGIVEGYNDDTFRPNTKINRAEFLKIVMEAKFPNRNPLDLRCFKDLEVKTPQWYARTTCAAEELGIVSGYPDGTFQPDKPVNLAEALKMAMRTFGIAPSAQMGQEWYEPYLNAARDRGILVSLLKFPEHLVTRGEMASIAFALVIEADHGTSSSSASAGICGNGIVDGNEQCDDGNTQDSDGCSSICILVSEPTRRAFLQIDQQASGTLSTIAKGQQDVKMLTFTAVAGRQDALLTGVTFDATVGSLLYATNYELMMDRDGDGTYETVAQANGKVTNNRLTFDSIVGGGITLPKGLIVPFVVRADLTNASGPVSLGIGFATSLPDYIQAQGIADNLDLEGIQTDNVCTASTCFITVNTRSGGNITVQEKGNLFVTEDSLSVRSHILLGGTTSDALLRLRMRAEGENVNVRTIRIDGIPSSVDALLLYKLSPGQAVTGTPFAQASNGQCSDQPSTRFCASLGTSALVINANQEVVIAVVARMKSDSLGGISGQTALLTLSSSAVSTTAAIEAHGTSSLQQLTQNDGDAQAEGEIFIGVQSPTPNSQISGKTSDVAFASIGSIQRDGASDVTAIPTGMSTIGGFKISALPHSNSMNGSNQVTIQSLTFQVIAQNVQFDPVSVRLTTKENPDAFATCTAPQSTGTFMLTCNGLAGSIQHKIDQGQSVTYRLMANITNPAISAGTSILNVSLPTLGQRSTTNSVVWSDEITTFQWVDVAETSVIGTTYRQ